MAEFRSAPRVIEKVLSPRQFKLDGQISEPLLVAETVIGICLHNQAKKLRGALLSALKQDAVQQGTTAIVILDDASTDNWKGHVADLLLSTRIVVVSAVCGSAARARNALLDWVEENLHSVRWVARLDADDRFADDSSVTCLVGKATEADADFVIGSNYLTLNRQRLPNGNIAEPSVLLDRDELLRFIQAFCLHGAFQELPSCNLIVSTGAGIRYPDVSSAEDHWLVAELLMLRPHAGLVVPYPVYSVYSLGGNASATARKSSQWQLQRRRLTEAVSAWHESLCHFETLLGVGQEGVVWKHEGHIHKRFYPWAMDERQVDKLNQLLQSGEGVVPKVSWSRRGDGCWECAYPSFSSASVPTKIGLPVVHQFLSEMAKAGYVAANIKRSNLRLDADGKLVYIDIGKDIQPFTPSRFLDASARLYGIGVLGYSDQELVRRNNMLRQHEALAQVPGFADFYRDLVECLFPHCKLNGSADELQPTRHEPRVTLLIKTCGQDADCLDDQVRHIVSQLSYPATFARVVLLIDSYPGPFLRQYAASDLSRVRKLAQTLINEGVVDEVWEPPKAASVVRQTFQDWFACNQVSFTHTSAGAPVFPQIWAFENVSTPYVLQCDVDVFIGRRDLTHDYLADMCGALESEDVVSVGFNIAQGADGLKPYSGEPGQYPPEVRCGLLHLDHLREMRPLPNDVLDGRLTLMWHRSVQSAQLKNGLRSVRGGDSRTFYVHPKNDDKESSLMSVWRDLIAQGREPVFQKDKWDLVGDGDWSYPHRDEQLVFLLKGRKTGYAKLQRCIRSLEQQVDQRFGLIVIDDGSPYSETWFLPLLLAQLWERTTLIRQRERKGYIPNFLIAIEEVCVNPETLIVTLDLDDALMSSEVTWRLMTAIQQDADLVNGFMFRPDKPLQLYEPDYVDVRGKGAGNVWTHMRGFKKKLFDSLPRHYLQVDGEWLDEVTDYAIMLPLAEMASNPLFLDDLFCYYHEREKYSDERKTGQRKLLSAIFSLPPAQQGDVVGSASV